jgi:hypothetical protein
MSQTCEFCKLTLKDKYSLKNHLIRNKNCLKTRGLTLVTKYNCKGCENSFLSKSDLVIHNDICKDYIVMKTREECKEEYINEINKLQNEKDEKDKEISKLLCELSEKYKEIDKLRHDINEVHVNSDKQIKNLQKICDNFSELQKYQINPDKVMSDSQTQIQTLQKMLENIATKAVDKPTITTNTTNTITNQIRNCFSTKHFLEDIKIADIKRKCQSSLTEQILMDGQRGIARLCTEQIINTRDKKKLLIATDHTRAKFRYMDKQGNLKDDIEARTFIEKVSKPIKEVADIVFDNVLSCIKDEKEMLEDDDYSRKAELNDKELQANRSMMYIKCFDDPKHNSDFTNELAILNKS